MQKLVIPKQVGAQTFSRGRNSLSKRDGSFVIWTTFHFHFVKTLIVCNRWCLAHELLDVDL